jgi:glutamate/tyrosine decarboxylase-like PLP-dependent enzyme
LSHRSFSLPDFSLHAKKLLAKRIFNILSFPLTSTKMDFVASKEMTVLPTSTQLQYARQQLIQQLDEQGIGQDAAIEHIRKDICPALNASSRSPNYYGFVTGGTTPAAAVADNIVTEFDQNLSVHLPNESIATDVEDKALSLLCQLLNFSPSDWKHRTFTTGATASNVLGLACGRQYAIEQAAKRLNPDVDLSKVNVAQVGLFKAMTVAGLQDVQILTTVPHSSLRKAASIVGLGRDALKLLGLKNATHKFDLSLLEHELSCSTMASIVSISCGDVNTGLFATTGDEMKQIRKLCDKYGAWIHVDGGMVAFASPS